MSKIAIVGGTGDLGLGLAARLSRSHTVIIGSRDASRARDAAAKASSLSGATVMGKANDEATRECDIAILAIPDLPSDEVLLALKPSLSDKLVVSPIVPMEFKDGLFVYTLPSGSATEKVASVLQTRVVGAFHNVPAAKLLQTEQEIEYDVLVTAETREIYAEGARVVSSTSKLRPLYAGPLRNSRVVEALTPTLLNVGKLNKIRTPSVRVI